MPFTMFASATSRQFKVTGANVIEYDVTVDVSQTVTLTSDLVFLLDGSFAAASVVG